MTVNLSDFLRQAAEQDPDGVALVEPWAERTITWAQFDEWADTVSRTLAGYGLVAGQRVALVMANGIDLAVAYFGVLRGGLVAVPLNPRSTAREIARVVADCQPKLIVADATSIESVRTAQISDTQIVTHRAAVEAGEIRFGDLLEKADTAAPIAPRDPETTAVVLYTSGSTGLPRGVILSHRALIANVEQIASLPEPLVGPGDVVLGLLPLFHIYGLNSVLTLAVQSRATVVLVDNFDPVVTLRTIVEHQVTSLPVAPPVIAAWAGLPELRESLAGVRLVISGASPLDPDLAELFYESSGHYVEQGYGLTEAAPVISTTVTKTRDAGIAPTPYSVGHPLPGIEFELRDSAGQLATPDDPAQVWVKGDNLFSGYWPDGVDGPGADGWYGTGDVGMLVNDGELAIVDRLRELVIVSGFNVYPSEVEDVIGGLDEVDQVAVVGTPDEKTGEAVVAFVVARATNDFDEAALGELILDHCRKNLARFKVPSHVVVADGLPHSPTGKIAKGRLRALSRRDDLNFGSLG